MKKRRGRPEIYRDILKVIKAGKEKRTRIMYAANLSSNPFQKIFETFITHGLVEENDYPDDKRTDNTYTLTQKGENALKHLTWLIENAPFLYRCSRIS